MRMVWSTGPNHQGCSCCIVPSRASALKNAAAGSHAVGGRTSSADIWSSMAVLQVARGDPQHVCSALVPMTLRERA